MNLNFSVNEKGNMDTLYDILICTSALSIVMYFGSIHLFNSNIYVSDVFAFRICVVSVVNPMPFSVKCCDGFISPWTELIFAIISTLLRVKMLLFLIWKGMVNGSAFLK